MGPINPQNQGLTLPKAWVNIGKSEQTLSITYVGSSRVKKLSSLVVEPVTFDRLKSIKKITPWNTDNRRNKDWISFLKGLNKNLMTECMWHQK